MLAHIRSYGSLGRLQSDGATEWMGKNWNMNSTHMPNVLNENFVVSFEVNFEVNFEVKFNSEIYWV